MPPWTAEEYDIIIEGKRRKLKWSQIIKGLPDRTVKAARNYYSRKSRKLGEQASASTATPVSARAAAPAASSATRVNGQQRRAPVAATPTGRRTAARLAAVSDSDSDDGGGPSLPPPISKGGPHVSAQAAAFEDSRQQRARGREGVRQQRETEQRAAEQHVAGQHAAERVAERMARDTETPGINLLGQNNDMEDFEQGGGTSGNDAPPCYRSLSAALTLRGSDQEDDDDDDVSMMAGSEATNHEEDPGYASDLYGADTEDMEE